MIGEWELRLSYEAAYLAMQHHELVIEVRHIVAGVRDLFLVQWRRQANRLGLRIRRGIRCRRHISRASPVGTFPLSYFIILQGVRQTSRVLGLARLSCEGLRLRWACYLSQSAALNLASVGCMEL